MSRRKKKITKNINIEYSQELKLKRIFGNDINFSEIFRQLARLGITLLHHRIIRDLSDESIETLRNDIIEEQVRGTSAKKVREYPEIFEELAKLGRYFVPDISRFPKILLNFGNAFSELNFEAMLKDPTIVERVKKFPIYSQMVDSVELNLKGDIFFQFTGNSPFTLLWYAKIVALALTGSPNHWEITSTFPEDLSKIDTLNLIRLNLKPGKSMGQSLDKVREIFSNIILMIKDTDSRELWNAMNDPLNLILDHIALDYLLNDDAKGIPFQHYLDELRMLEKDQIKCGLFLLEFYRKLNLVTHISLSGKRVILRLLHPAIFEMLKVSWAYLEIKYKVEGEEEQPSNYIITFLD